MVTWMPPCCDRRDAWPPRRSYAAENETSHIARRLAAVVPPLVSVAHAVTPARVIDADLVVSRTPCARRLVALRTKLVGLLLRIRRRARRTVGRYSDHDLLFLRSRP
jgi:hypothetical protein